MVKLLFLFSFIVYGFQLYAQIEFLKVYSNTGFDKGEGITQLSDSSYLLTGSSTSFGDGPPQAFLLKVDSLGNHLWAKHYGGSEINEGKRVFAFENSAYFIGGNTNSNSSADFNFYFVKTDLNGDPLFEKQMGTTAWDFVHDGVMLSDSTFILTGETFNTPDGKEDAYTIRLNRNGDTIWTSQSHKPGIDKIFAAETVGDTAFVLAGTVWNEDSLAQKSFLGFYKYDNSVIWEKEYGIIGDYQIKDVELWNNVFHCVGNRILIADSLHDEYVVRINLVGDTLSGYSYIGASEKSMNKIVKTGTTNKFYVATNVRDQYTYGAGEDIAIERYSDFFAFEYSGLQFHAGGQDDIGDLIKTNDGGAIMIGTNRSYGNQNANVFLIKIGPNDLYPNVLTIPIVNSLVQIEEMAVTKVKFGAYPNPTSGKFILNDADLDGELLIYNSVGQLVKTIELTNDSKYLDISDLEKGIYHLRYYSKNSQINSVGMISKF